MDYMGQQYYDEGWNAFINGQGFRAINSTRDWQTGWLDCKEATEKYGRQQRI